MKLNGFVKLWLFISLLVAILLVVQKAPVTVIVFGAIFGGLIYAFLARQVSIGFESTTQWRSVIIVWIVAVIGLSSTYMLRIHFNGAWSRSGANLAGLIGLFSGALGLGGIWRLIKTNNKDVEPISPSNADAPPRQRSNTGIM